MYTKIIKTFVHVLTVTFTGRRFGRKNMKLREKTLTYLMGFHQLSDNSMLSYDDAVVGDKQQSRDDKRKSIIISMKWSKKV